jgi:nucleoside-diphosphate-sugar epimerase
VHLAGVHRIGLAERAAREEYPIVNVAGSSRLAEAEAMSGTRRLVFLSSIAVFGSSADRPVNEATPWLQTLPTDEASSRQNERCSARSQMVRAIG